ncbi:hypothetical protein HanIR_Chr01g0028441 [Helianthus annuus]|nr:hypothetical protein HanIR_Chr01g0028441 [Helianthus annuus]
MCGIPATSWIASKIPRVLWRLWNSLAAAVVAAVQLRRGDVSGGIGAAVSGRRCNWVWLTNLGQMLYLPSKPRYLWSLHEQEESLWDMDRCVPC